MTPKQRDGCVYTAEDVSFFPPHGEENMQSRLSRKCFFKLYVLHMALGGGAERVACLAHCQLTAQLDIAEQSKPPLSRSVSLWDCFRKRKCIQPLSLSVSE